MSKGHSVPVKLKCEYCTEWRTGGDENTEYGFCDYLGMFKTHKDESCPQIAWWLLGNSNHALPKDNWRIREKNS